MKAAIEVASRNEAELIKAGLNDPVTRSVVVVQGALASLNDDNARRRVLRFVAEMFNIELQNGK